MFHRSRVGQVDAIITFVCLLEVIDRLFQRRIRSILPQRDDFLRDPAKYLAENEIAIGSMRRFVMSGFLGLAVASPICCGGFSMYRENHPRPGPEPASETLSVLGGILLVAA